MNVEKLCRELIALPSVNPAFVPERDPHAGEERVAQFLAATAATAGLDIAFQGVLPGRANLIARLSPRGKVRRRIWLVPHLDTVNAAEPQFHPKKMNDRLYGRGACDTKASVAVMMTVLCRMAQSNARPVATEISFAGVIDEENAQRGSRALAAGRVKPDLAIVGEPTRLRVVTAHKGSLWLRLETRGKAAHGAQPGLGRNAVHAMARVVDFLETEYAAQLRRRRHPLLGHATVSVGVIAGGTQPNIVPDLCRIEVDRRTLPGESELSVHREIRGLLARHGLSVQCGDSKLAPCLPLETNPRLPLVAQLLRALDQPKPSGVDYFCDASVLAQGGIPSVVFGPGDIAQAHTDSEWIDVRSLERGAAMLARFLHSLP